VRSEPTVDSYPHIQRARGLSHGDDRILA